MLDRPRYRLVVAFYAMALGWVSLVALALYVLGFHSMSAGTALAAQLTVGFLYMPAPMVAALIVERMAGRGYLIRTLFDGFWRKLPRLLVASACVVLGAYGLMVAGVFVLGNVLHVGGVGEIVSTQAALAENISQLLGPLAPSAPTASSLPAPLLLLAIGGLAGIAAGFTVNGVFAFGEEYGWRGWLMNELAPLGAVRANLLTGVLWGLWHAPLIVMGFNYAPYRIAGVFAMCGLTTSLAFLLWRARQYTGSLLAPAILHGSFNGFQGFFLLLVASRNPLVSAPTGVVAWAAIGIVAALLWTISRGRLRDEPPSAPAENPAHAAAASGDTIPAA